MNLELAMLIIKLTDDQVAEAIHLIRILSNG